MSRAAELARAEAERVEAEEVPATGDPGDETQPAATAEPVEPAEQAKKIEQLEREIDRRAKALERIMGDDFAALTECPTCAGFVPGYIVQGQEVLPEPRMADTIEACPQCAGYGRLRTPSLADGHDSILCQRCGGKGWTDKVSEQATVPVVPLFPGVAQALENLGPAAQAYPDAWGRPSGHPHYGMAPAQVGA